MNRIRYTLRIAYAALPFKKPIFLVLRSIIRLPAMIYQHLHFIAPITIQIKRGKSFKIFHYGHQVENDLFWAGYGNGWEATSLRLWVRLVTASNTVFDIGANTGVYALAAKSVNTEAKVFAFEPVASIVDKLKKNVEINGFDINIIQAGVSSHTGDAFIYVPSTDHSYSASLNPDMSLNQSNMVKKRIKTLRIDDFIERKNLSSADLFKIDTEKHEVDVLSGFGKVIERFRPSILIEILDRDFGEKIKDFFNNYDYIYYEIIEGKQVSRVDELGGSSRNYLICSREFSAKNGLGDSIQHDEL